MNRREFAGLAVLAPLVASAVNSHGESTNKPSLLLPDTARVFDIGQGEARILVGAEQSDGKWWLGSVRSNPHRKTSLHIHYSADEYIYVLDGVLSTWVDGKWHDLPAGALAIVPRGAPHALGNRSVQSMRYLILGNPAGFERFFADIEKLAHHTSSGDPEFLVELAKIYTRYDSKLLGPPPEG